MVGDPVGACEAFEQLTGSLPIIDDRKLAELGGMRVSVDATGFSVSGMPAATIAGDPRFFRVTERGVAWNDTSSSSSSTGPLGWGSGRVGFATVAEKGYECEPITAEPPQTSTTREGGSWEEEAAKYDFTYESAVCEAFGAPPVELVGWRETKVTAADGRELKASSSRALPGNLTNVPGPVTVTIETCGPTDVSASTSTTAPDHFQPWGRPGDSTTVSVVSRSDGQNVTLATIGPALAPEPGAYVAPAWIYRGDLATSWYAGRKLIEIDLRWNGDGFIPVRRIQDAVVEELG